MSTPYTIKTQLVQLIAAANQTTGGNAENITDGVNALIGGFGQGGSSGANVLKISTKATRDSQAIVTLNTNHTSILNISCTLERAEV